MTGTSRLWPNLRAALIALAAAVSMLEGCPTPRTSRALLAVPVHQAELARWSGILSALGVALSPAEVGDWAMSASNSANTLQAKLLTPFRPFFDLLNVSQRWSLFPIADTHPVWMHIEARCGTARDYALVYRPNDPDADWEADVLEYRRVRAAWNPSIRGPRDSQRAFVDWVARRLFDQRPECNAVRVRYRTMTLPAPGQVGVRYGEFVWGALRRRDEVGR